MRGYWLIAGKYNKEVQHHASHKNTNRQIRMLLKRALRNKTSQPLDKGNNHEMSGGQGVHGEVVPLKKGPVPPSTPSPCTTGTTRKIIYYNEKSRCNKSIFVAIESIAMTKKSLQAVAINSEAIG